MERPLKIAIVGASGFIGRKLIEDLLECTDYLIVALSRLDRSHLNTDRITWKKCDLFSLTQITKSLSDCHSAIYLVHSMLPSARLSQGTFADYDLVLANHFAKAAKTNQIKHIIYLGGLIPDAPKISIHLYSRLEVERTFQASEIPLTSLRAGIIIGPGSSSFTILDNLIKKHPLLLCPPWALTLTCPTSIWDISKSLLYCIDNEQVKNKTFDLGGPETLSWMEMMKKLAKLTKKKRFIFKVPYLSLQISKLWVSVLTGAPKNLIYPLISSLLHHMVADPKKKLKVPDLKMMNVEQTFVKTLSFENQQKDAPHAFTYTGDQTQNEVRSIQRLNTLLRSKVSAVSKEYFKWLPQFFYPLVEVINEDRGYCFYFKKIKWPLLILTYSPEKSTDERQLYFITGGLLVKKSHKKGRFEFLSILDGRYVLAAIHEFYPALPWYLYKCTQALIHLFVMRSFNKHLIDKRF